MSRIPLLLLLSANFLLPPARADTLKDVQGSKEYNRYRHPIRSKALLNERWFDKDSNFAKLFFNIDGGARLLVSWSGEAALNLSSGEVELLRALEYAGIRRKYTFKEGIKVELKILVPHPMFFDTTQLGLVKGFMELEPPALRVTYIDDLEIQGFAAKIYHHEDKACSMVVRLARGALINMETGRCDDRDALIQMMKVLDLKGLDEKLQS